jgi:hypothetical protein
MDEDHTSALERSSTAPSLAPQAAGLAAAPDCRGVGRERGGREPVGDTCPRGRPTSGAASPSIWRAPTIGCRATRPSARPLAPGSRGLWFPWPGLDAGPSHRGPAAGVRCLLPPCACRPVAQGHPVEPQQPARRARQRDEAAIAHGREQTWPALKGGRRSSNNASSS